MFVFSPHTHKPAEGTFGETQTSVNFLYLQPLNQLLFQLGTQSLSPYGTSGPQLTAL